MASDLPCLRWQLVRRPSGAIAPGDLALVEYTSPALAPEHVRVRNIHLSLDPTQRIWMTDREQYLPPIQVGQAMRGTTIGVVVESRSERLRPGELVLAGLAGWETVSDLPAKAVSRVRRLPGVPLTAHLSVLGNTGLTAWAGMVLSLIHI